MISYDYDKKCLEISEKSNGPDTEFRIRILSQDQDGQEAAQALKKIRYDFERNDVLTDVLFYVHPNRDYQIIVRKDYYLDFMLSLFKYGLLSQISHNS
ncbi:hypothetical protein [Paenibacillus hamazuiensis]|uniref:hypothetical protein n=1 Tax=Paenibacillus hamazuiensis TaxID=2936508 RepID=UPI00200E7598|nr:hypothetical protein [Paenibacillus hamazuiensis]